MTLYDVSEQILSSTIQHNWWRTLAIKSTADQQHVMRFPIDSYAGCRPLAE